MGADIGSSTKTTSHKVVLPFYIYAAISFLMATVFLFIDRSDYTGAYFQPHILAVTHIMALGWVTMIILGASHQLVPVLIEGKLYSPTLAALTFLTAAIGIPLLVFSFYVFNMGNLALTGGVLIALAVLMYLFNLGISISRSKGDNIHAVFILTSAAWLFITVTVGILLLYNFTHFFLSRDSLYFLSLHAHLGMVGWFVMLIMGVASRLIPMFLISKYKDPRTLWIIYVLNNSALVLYSTLYASQVRIIASILSLILLLLSIILFARYIYKAYSQRIRRSLDEQMQLSLASVAMILFPILVIALLISATLVFNSENTRLTLLYGFMVFFGWITAIIFGMTFKTLPFIVWNKIYHERMTRSKAVNPKDLFSHSLFKVMSTIYLVGFATFATGIFLSSSVFLFVGSLTLMLSAVLYNLNVFKVFLHKPGGS